MLYESQEVEQNQRVIVLGPPGSGKTNLALSLLLLYLKRDLRDIYVTIHERPQHYDRVLKRFGFVKTVLNQKRWEGILAQAEQLEQAPREVLARIISQHRRICFSVESISHRDQDLAVSEIAYAVLDLGSAVLLLDEGYKFVPSNRKQDHGVFNLINGGRAEGCDLIIVTPFRGDTTPLAIEGATCVVSFKQVSPHELEKIGQWFGERAGELKELERFEYLAADTEGRIWRGKTRERFENA